MRKRVVVTGIGSISPVGNDIDTAWDNLVNGVSGIGQITHFDSSEYKTKIAAEVKGFDGAGRFGRKEARRMDRVAQFALAASLQAVEHSRLEINETNRNRIGVVISTGIGGLGTLYKQMQVHRERGPNRVSPFLVPMMLPDTSGGIVAINLGVRGPNMAVVTACASGTNSIGEGTEIIRRGQADVILAGGTEAAIVEIAMAGMSVMGALSQHNHEPHKASRPFDRERDGFIMGEGAATLVLESLSHAQSRGAEILAEVTGYGSTNDAYHISAPAENGLGAELCMKMAIDDGDVDKSEIGYINAHGTSTPLNDKSETAAIKSVFGEQAYNIPISSTKSLTGHLLGAAGALEATFCVKVIEKDLIPATMNYQTFDPDCDLDYVPNKPREISIDHVMSNSFGFGGHNASIILSRFAEN